MSALGLSVSLRELRGRRIGDIKIHDSSTQVAQDKDNAENLAMLKLHSRPPKD
jgi:hypothetical protein